MDPLSPTKEVLRAQRDAKGAVVIDRVAVCDACCGPNEPMASDAEAMYARLGERMAMAASSRLFAPQRISGVNAVPPCGGLPLQNRLASTQGTPRAALPGGSGRLYFPPAAAPTAGASHDAAPKPSPPPPSVAPPHKGGLHAVGPSGAYPRATAGAVLSTSCANAYFQKLDVAALLQELRQDADCAREMQALEYERKLRDQGMMWERRTTQLEDEIRKLRHLLVAVDEAVAQGAVVEQPQAQPAVGSGRHCGGHAPAGGVLRRPPRARHAARYPGAGDDADPDLSPQRITEALIHVLEKQPMHILLRKRNIH